MQEIVFKVNEFSHRINLTSAIVDMQPQSWLYSDRGQGALSKEVDIRKKRNVRLYSSFQPFASAPFLDSPDLVFEKPAPASKRQAAFKSLPCLGDI